MTKEQAMQAEQEEQKSMDRYAERVYQQELSDWDERCKRIVRQRHCSRARAEEVAGDYPQLQEFRAESWQSRLEIADNWERFEEDARRAEEERDAQIDRECRAILGE